MLRAAAPNLKFIARKAGIKATGPRRWARYSTNAHVSRPGITIRTASLSATALLSVSLGLGAYRVYADYEEEATAPRPSLKTLVRSYFVFSMCSVPRLVDASPKILEVLSSIPGIKQLTEAFVRVTFFDHFVGGDTAQGCLPLLRSFRSQNKGALFAYSVEVDENEANTVGISKVHSINELPHKKIVEEMIRCIDVAADFEDEIGAGAKGCRTWVAIKITALIPNAHSLIKLSSHIIKTRPPSETSVPFPGCPQSTDLDVLYSPDSAPELDKGDIDSLLDLHADLVKICIRAQERGVKIIIDAEYSWYQPALDALTLALMRQFNQLSDSSSEASPVQPLIYGTYQAYLRRTPQHLQLALEDARANHYALGIKLVRGAYHPHELAAYLAAASYPRKPSPSISPDAVPPVWEHKEDTDARYNECVEFLIRSASKDIELRKKEYTKYARKGWFGNWLWGTVSAESSDSQVPERTIQNNNVPGVGILFGTHNWKSCSLILDELVKNKLAIQEGDVVVVGDEGAERVTVGQLYGMSDDLTDSMVQRTKSTSPFVIKYVPYGALSEVMPYLSRRAIENKSILGDGGAIKERKRAGDEIWKRIKPF
ncbi:FAD-linked oxidoreductase-like protein [Crucibulum laeve]|uniref:Proline dehydrogenase n=1 Tax=Crucibulum laeve TaxID=68775 RepID=A0A5C3M0H3_9AGAR|nr:FAD-linked oxidoreductase-like protein [Crucibulum laeve]